MSYRFSRRSRLSAESFGGRYELRTKIPYMEFTIRDAKPDDAAGIVAVFNPIIAAGSFVGKAERHAKLHGRYVDVIIVERLL